MVSFVGVDFPTSGIIDYFRVLGAIFLVAPCFFVEIREVVLQSGHRNAFFWSACSQAN